MKIKNANLFLLLIILFAGTILTTSCGKDDDDVLLPVEQRIVGTWTIQNSIIFDQQIPGDGSTLTFKECKTTCSGTDYLGSDESTGTFTYAFIENDTVLSIDDDDSEAGGSYTGDWNIEQFTNSTLTLSGDTFFGKVSFTFSK